MRLLNKVIFAIILSIGFFSCSKKNIGFFNNNYKRYEARGQNSAQTAPENIQASSSDNNRDERLSGFEQVQSDNSNSNQYISNVESGEKPSEATPQKNKLTKEQKKDLRRDIKNLLKNRENNESGLGTLVLVILAILLPPLAVALVDGISGPFWLSILLTILFYVPGLIYALWRIFRR